MMLSSSVPGPTRLIMSANLFTFPYYIVTLLLVRHLHTQTQTQTRTRRHTRIHFHHCAPSSFMLHTHIQKYTHTHTHTHTVHTLAHAHAYVCHPLPPTPPCQHNWVIARYQNRFLFLLPGPPLKYRRASLKSCHLTPGAC